MSDALKILVIEDNEDDFVLLKDRVGRLTDFDAELIYLADAQGVVERVRELSPTVIMLDYRLGGTDGVAVLGLIRAAGLSTPVIVLTGQGDQYVAAEITRAGADDYLMKDDLESDRLPAALARAVAKSASASAGASERADMLAKLKTLTPRETEVLEHIVAGLTNKQIAATLRRSIETVKVHRAHIMSKTKADSTADLVRKVVTARLG